MFNPGSTNISLTYEPIRSIEQNNFIYLKFKIPQDIFGNIHEIKKDFFFNLLSKIHVFLVRLSRNEFEILE